MTQAEGGAGSDQWAAPEPGRICESCGWVPAIQVLDRRPSWLAMIERRRIETSVMLYHPCWLDILCGLRAMPPERDRIGPDQGQS